MSAAAPFGARTTLRVGGEAAELVEVGDIEELERLAVSIGSDRAVYVLGRGSNTLVADAGFDGVVIQLGEGFAQIAIDDRRVEAGGAADLPVVARRSVEAGLTGFEWAVGVPGSLGGAVAMNAGGHGSDMASCLIEAEVIELGTGERRRLSTAELDFGYRRSAIGARQVVISATLELAPGDREEGRARLREIVAWRRANQPGGANCGSVFANPPGSSAGALIDAAGLKGATHGSASVSEKHANFIQAQAGGSGDDVAALMLELVEEVAATSGVELHSEVRLVGFDDELVARLGGARP